MVDQPVDGWTDLHIHPRAADWRLPLAELPELLAAMGAREIGCLYAHAVADRWDAPEETPPPLFESTAVPVAELVPRLDRPDIVHAAMLLAPHDLGFDTLAAALRAGSRHGWDACVATLGWGPCSIPDLRYQHTLARFGLSVGVSGPGLPGNPERGFRAIPASTDVVAACQRLDELLGTECVAHIAYGES